MKIGLIGTGLMGQPMAIRLLGANVSVIAYNRTPDKLQPIADAGGIVADSPDKVIQEADCTILMLTDGTAIAETILTDKAISYLPHHTIIQMATIAPQESRAIRERVVAAGGEYLEAPVLGSIPQVKTGELIVMVGSTRDQFIKWCSVLKHFSPEPIHTGEVGTAAAMKLALNQLIASLTSAFALSLGFVQREGVNVEQFMSILRESALYAPTFDKKLSRMRERNFTNPNFPTKHLLKDTDLFLTQAEALGLDTSSLKGIRQIIQKAIALGLENEDYSAIYSAINIDS
ncbi:MAG: NAD(P)-dependent oxidoreductase [Xenococcaceae cyanobacterium MO_167.B27]|nr:NAD(P)-dependent oxidoreductase [Xenococcaceae cyanobacterium MO_167.B27]